MGWGECEGCVALGEVEHKAKNVYVGGVLHW